jgi:hypothetical protein
MKFRDEEFDVHVSKDVLVEVWRGEHVSQAQQFGATWDGPLHTAMHEAVFAEPMREVRSSWHHGAHHVLAARCDWAVFALASALVLSCELGLWR